MSNQSTLHIIHILECIQRIEEYTEGDQELFLSDRKTYDAVVRNLQTLSESTQKLDAQVKSEAPNIPWQKISGFRNILVHGYLGDIDAKQIWEVIEKYIPQLRSTMQQAHPNWKEILDSRD